MRTVIRLLGLMFITLCIIPAVSAEWSSSGGNEGQQRAFLESGNGIPDPMERWATTDDTITTRGAAVVDMKGNIEFSGDEFKPGPFVIYGKGASLYIRDGATGTTAFRLDYQTTGLVPAPAAGDIDGDGKTEIVTITVEGSMEVIRPELVHLGNRFSSSSEYDSLWERNLPGTVLDASPVMVDLDGSGSKEILAVGGRTLMALDGRTGTVIWQYPLSGTVASSPAVSSFGPSSSLVFISVFDSSTTPDTHKTVILDQDGILRDEMSFWVDTGTSRSVAPPVTGDFDGDGVDDVAFVTSSEGGNAVLRGYSGRDSFTELFTANMNGVCNAPLAVGDLDGDGSDDIIVVTAKRAGTLLLSDGIRVAGVTGEGDIIFELSYDTGTTELLSEAASGAPLILHLDGDQYPDVLVPVTGGKVLGIEGHSGGRVWDRLFFEIPGHPDIGSAVPAAFDLEGDGYPEVFVDGTVMAEHIGDLEVRDNDISILSTSPSLGDTIEIRAYISNPGTAAYSDVPYSVTIDDVEVTDGTISSLLPGSSLPITVQWLVDIEGLVDISIEADPVKDLRQSRTGNDRGSTTLFIKPALGVNLASAVADARVDPGQQTLFDVTIENIGRDAGDFLLTILSAPDGWDVQFLSTALNVGVNQTKSTSFTVRPPSTALAGVHLIKVYVTTLTGDIPLDTLDFAVVVNAHHGVDISLPEEPVILPPGGTTKVILQVDNQGNTLDTFRFELAAPAGGWVVRRSDLALDEFELGPRQIRTIGMVISAPVAATEGLLENATIRVYSTEDASADVTVLLPVEVALPDLNITFVRFLREKDHLPTLAPVENETVSMSLAISNDGRAKSFSTDALLTFGGQQTWIFLGEIEGGATSYITVPVVIPSAGNTTLTLELDVNGTLAQTNTSNDEGEFIIPIRPEVPTDTLLVLVDVTAVGGSGPETDATVMLTNGRTAESMLDLTNSSGSALQPGPDRSQNIASAAGNA